jgi:hypothetical protein
MKDMLIASRTFATMLLLAFLSWATPGAAIKAIAADTSNNATNLALVGTVKDTTGAPISNAWVFVDAARPRQGPGFL